MLLFFYISFISYISFFIVSTSDSLYNIINKQGLKFYNFSISLFFNKPSLLLNGIILLSITSELFSYYFNL